MKYALPLGLIVVGIFVLGLHSGIEFNDNRNKALAPSHYHIVCVHPSPNQMDVYVEGNVYVAGNAWGVIEKQGSKAYFWPGSCTITPAVQIPGA